MSEPRRGGRRAVSDAEARSILRSGLMDRYRADPRYQAIVKQDLAPLWRKVAVAPGWREEFPPTSFSFMDILDELSVLESQVPESIAAPLTKRYVQAVARTVGHSMGLIDEGRPANWVLREVHEHVTGRGSHARLLAVSPRAEDDDLTLTLDLTPNYVGVRYYPDKAETNAPSDQEFDLSMLGVGYGAEHWAELERIACGIIHDAIAIMREDIEARHPMRNPTYIARWGADLDDLHHALFHKDRPLNPAEATRLRRIANLIGIDPPSRRTERASSLGWAERQVTDDG